MVCIKLSFSMKHLESFTLCHMIQSRCDEQSVVCHWKSADQRHGQTGACTVVFVTVGWLASASFSADKDCASGCGGWGGDEERHPSLSSPSSSAAGDASEVFIEILCPDTVDNTRGPALLPFQLGPLQECPWKDRETTGRTGAQRHHKGTALKSPSMGRQNILGLFPQEEQISFGWRRQRRKTPIIDWDWPCHQC